MTVTELIEELRKYPGNLRVINYEGFDVADVELDHWHNKDGEPIVVIS